MSFYFFRFNYFHQFSGFFYLYLLEKTNGISIYKIGCLKILLSYIIVG